MLEESELFNMLNKDEKVLWSGKPNFKCIMFEAIFNPFLFFTFFCILSCILYVLLDSYSYTTITESAKKIDPFIFLFVINLISIFGYFLWVIASFIRYKHKEFAITDKGVYISGGVIKRTFEHKPWAELTHVNIHRGIFDQIFRLGDVVLTSTQDGYRDVHSTYKGLTICDIPDYLEVYQMVKKLQADIYSDIMYPNDLRPEENHGYNTVQNKNIEN